MSGSQRKIRRAEEPQQEAQQGHDAGNEDVHMRTLDAAERGGRAAERGGRVADRGGRAAAHPRLPIPDLADPLPSAEHLWAALAIPEPDEALGDRVAPPPPPPATAEKESNNENKPARKAPRYPMLLPWDEQSWSTGSNPDNDTEELTPPRPPTPMPWEEESVSTDPNMEQNWAFVEDLADLEELEEPAEPTGSLALTPESQPPTPPAAACPMQEDIDTPSVTPCPSPEPESPLDATAWDESETSSGGGNSSHGCCQSVSIGTRSVVAKATTGLGSYPDQGERQSTSAAVRQWLRYQSETSSSASTPERALALAIGFPSAYPALDEGPSTSAAARAWLQQQRGTSHPIPYVGYHMPSLSPMQEVPMQPLVIMVDPEETGILSRPPTSPPPGWEEAPDHWRVRIDNRHLPHRLIQHVVGQEREGRNSHRSFLYNANGILFRVRFNKRNEVTISLRSPI